MALQSSCIFIKMVSDAETGVPAVPTFSSPFGILTENPGKKAKVTVGSGRQG